MSRNEDLQRALDIITCTHGVGCKCPPYKPERTEWADPQRGPNGPIKGSNWTGD